MQLIKKVTLFQLFLFSIVATFLSAIVKGTWDSPFPNTTEVPFGIVQYVGRGFPFLWWRTETGLAEGTIHMSTIFASAASFVGDIIFWFFVLLLVRFIVSRVAERK